MDTEAQRARVKKWATIGLVGLVGLIVSPIIFLAIQGLVGLVIAGVVGLSIVTFTPWMTMKFANWKVQAIIYEAKENPIETMINLLAAKQIAFKEFQVNVTTAVTARNNFKSKIETFAAKYPARAPEFKTQLVRMTDLVERKKKALNDAEHMLEEGHTKLEEMKAYWDMSQAAQAANKAAGMDTGDQFERLKSDTAVDAVFESMNRAFAELEVAAALDVDSDDRPVQSVAQLTNNKSDVIDVVVNTQKVSVQ
jgi:hypothetical protein